MTTDKTSYLKFSAKGRGFMISVEEGHRSPYISPSSRIVIVISPVLELSRKCHWLDEKEKYGSLLEISSGLAVWMHDSSCTCGTGCSMGVCTFDFLK